MDDAGCTRWKFFVVPLVLTGFAAVPARADMWVNRLSRDPIAVEQRFASCCSRTELIPLYSARFEEQAASEPKPPANSETNALPLVVLATVLFSNPDHASPQTTGVSGGLAGGLANGLGAAGATSGVGAISGGTTGNGGTPPIDHAPEPATLISALVGMSLAGLYAVFHRKQLVKPETMRSA